MSVYTLYARNGSGSMVVEGALLKAGAAYRRVEVGKDDPVLLAELAALNPARKIPVLVLPDGQAISESAAILIVLDEMFPQAGLLPASGSSERRQALQWLAFLASSTYPAALNFYYASRYTADPREEAAIAVQKAAASALDRDFGLIADAWAGPFLGKQHCIVDLYALMLADWHAPALQLPKIAVLKSAILAVPAYHKAWISHDYAV